MGHEDAGRLTLPGVRGQGRRLGEGPGQEAWIKVHGRRETSMLTGYDITMTTTSCQFTIVVDKLNTHAKSCPNYYNYT